jgi:hypothetical protein
MMSHACDPRHLCSRDRGITSLRLVSTKLVRSYIKKRIQAEGQRGYASNSKAFAQQLVSCKALGLILRATFKKDTNKCVSNSADIHYAHYFR